MYEITLKMPVLKSIPFKTLLNRFLFIEIINLLDKDLADKDKKAIFIG